MIINTTWTNLKEFAVERVLAIQYVTTNQYYYLSAIDGTMELLAQIHIDGTVIRVVCTPFILTSITWIANFGGYEI